MGVSLTWLGHSAFEVRIDGHSILFDPFLTDNPLASTTADTLNPELIFLSHAHNDHLGDTVAIARRTGATVVCNFEISQWMEKQGVKAEALNVGGAHDFGVVTAKLTTAQHSSSFPDGTYGGEPNGFILTAGGKRLYFAGDTALFTDMTLIGDEGIDLAFLPIGGHFTMEPSDSLKAVQMIRPRVVLPMHYNTWERIMQDASDWANHVSSETSAQPIVLDPGGTYTLD